MRDIKSGQLYSGKTQGHSHWRGHSPLLLFLRGNVLEKEKELFGEGAGVPRRVVEMENLEYSA